MKKSFLILVFLMSCILAQESEDAATEPTAEPSKDFKLTGYTSYQGGQVLSGSYKYKNDIDHYWYQKLFGNIGFIKDINDWLTVTVGFEVSMRVSFIAGNTFPETQRFLPEIYLDQAKGDFKFFDTDAMKMYLTVGYFYFRYNKDVRNLGNNLYKSYCYPTVIVQPEFDFPFTRVCGLDFHSVFLNGMLQNDLVLTTHLQFYPAGDFSLTDVVAFKPINGINVGAGIQFDRLLSVSEKLTRPRVMYEIDPAAPNDSIFYTFAGTKLMFLLNFDPKKFIYSDDDQMPFGAEDLKIYGELNVLGLKNYYKYYEKINERMPISMGFNIPTFKILDVLALEAEYFGPDYPNSIERPVNSNIPKPEIPPGSNPGDWKKDNWKWSLYAKKNFSNFTIIAQAARDHLQLWSYREVDRIYRDNLDENRNWYYQFKFLFNF